MLLTNQLVGFGSWSPAIVFLESFEAAFSGEIPNGWSRTESAATISMTRSSTWAREGTYSCRGVFSEASANQRNERFERTYDLTRVRYIFADLRADYWNNHGSNTPMMNVALSVTGATSNQARLVRTTASSDTPFSSPVEELNGYVDCGNLEGNQTVKLVFSARDCNYTAYIDNLRFIG